MGDVVKCLFPQRNNSGTDGTFPGFPSSGDENNSGTDGTFPGFFDQWKLVNVPSVPGFVPACHFLLAVAGGMLIGFLPEALGGWPSLSCFLRRLGILPSVCEP